MPNVTVFFNAHELQALKEAIGRDVARAESMPNVSLGSLRHQARLSAARKIYTAIGSKKTARANDRPDAEDAEP